MDSRPKVRTGGRKSNGQFGPGNSGRPPGARHKTTLAIEQLLDGDAEAITKKAISLAKRGDPTALRLCLERIAPPRKGRTVQLVNMPKIASAADVPGALAFILQQVAEGELTSDEGNDLAAMLDRYIRAVELSDMERRLREIEDRLG